MTDVKGKDKWPNYKQTNVRMLLTKRRKGIYNAIKNKCSLKIILYVVV